MAPFFVDGALNLTGRITSILFENTIGYVDSIRSWKLPSVVQKDAVKCINLSQCNILDPDLTYLVEFVKQFPNCKWLNLSYNRIHGLRPETRSLLDDGLRAILELKITVNVIATPFASMNRLDFFQNILTTPQVLQFLIFIPKNWLEGMGWVSLVKQRPDFDEVSKIILQAHHAYFEKFP